MQDLSAALDRVIKDVIEPQAVIVDRDGTYPRAALDALGEIGVLGLMSSPEVGGGGQPLRVLAMVVEKIGRVCPSTAMVLVMHYCSTDLIEYGGPREIREAIAAGRHVTTCAFTEPGTRSNFWAVEGRATLEGDRVRLDGKKSYATSAGHADSYTWLTRPLAAEGPSTLWFVPGRASGLAIPSRYDGLGLRGNASGPITAEGVMVPRDAMIGKDGGGFDLLMTRSIPAFNVLTGACYLGIMEAATEKTTAHVRSTRFSHAGQSLGDLPMVRAHLARMRLLTDMVRLLLMDALAATEAGREDAMLRLLEIKVAVGDIGLEVTDLAMRVCAGSAFRKDLGLDRCFRDSRASGIMTPSVDLCYDFIGRALVGLPLL